MKIRKICWVSLVFALLCAPLVFAQTTKPNPGNFDRFVQQVYTGEGQKTIRPESRRYAFMKECFENRISFITSDKDKLANANFKRLSDIPLFNHYNKALMRDAGFDPATFNPFKYHLGFYEKETQVIHVDGTNYLIVIAPQTSAADR
ncbi:hypothetical protein [Gilvibacter sediminis]|uniref:hypothetical protein n=1 Tax=Gilvibacter sediminis TaxID=379071 RepID=UPI002350339F|nr:hypothetical protein [Gilvibacter sediminis]MDC7997692.1 hypothetical protein [Gilvibacter sediminis]